MAEQQTAQDREARAQNVANIQARRKQVVARMKNENDADRAKSQEELDSIDANLRAMGEGTEPQEKRPEVNLFNKQVDQ